MDASNQNRNDLSDQVSNDHNKNAEAKGRKPERIPITYTLSTEQRTPGSLSASAHSTQAREASVTTGIFVNRYNNRIAKQIPEIEIRWTPPEGLSLEKDYIGVQLFEKPAYYSFNKVASRRSIAETNQATYVFTRGAGDNSQLQLEYEPELILIVPENTPLPGSIIIYSNLTNSAGLFK